MYASPRMEETDSFPTGEEFCKVGKISIHIFQRVEVKDIFSGLIRNCICGPATSVSVDKSLFLVFPVC